MIPVVSMFLYMHINRSKLYPYQLMMIPLYVLVLSFLLHSGHSRFTFDVISGESSGGTNVQI